MQLALLLAHLRLGIAAVLSKQSIRRKRKKLRLQASQHALKRLMYLKLGADSLIRREGKSKFKMEVGQIYKLKFDPDRSRRQVGARELALKGKHFQALVLDYKFQDGEIAVQVEWKDGPAGQCADIKDKKQVILLSEFDADYFLLPRFR